MTRFDASTEDARKKLFADAIRAHRERESAFLTLEVERNDAPADADDPEPAPWVQFADGIVNLDCTDDELERLKSLLDAVSVFTIEDLTSPENADGTNVLVSARADAERVAAFLDRVFREVYECPETYRAWVTAV